MYFMLHKLRPWSQYKNTLVIIPILCMELESDAIHAFWGCDWVARLIGAVVIDHVVHSDPPVAPCLDGIHELLVCCSFPPVVRVGGTAHGARNLASFNIKVLVVSIEWCFAPINFL